MAKNDNTIYDPNEVEMKLPEENFFETDEPVKTVSVFPYILIGVIMLLIGVLGVLVWWGLELYNLEGSADTEITVNRPTAEENNEPESTNAEADVETIGALSSSDEVNAIEADLMGTNIENIDREMVTIESELTR